jgi:hypothetical protein
MIVSLKSQIAGDYSLHDIRELKPEDLIETRSLRDLTVKGGVQ